MNLLKIAYNNIYSYPKPQKEDSLKKTYVYLNKDEVIGINNIFINYLQGVKESYQYGAEDSDEDELVNDVDSADSDSPVSLNEIVRSWDDISWEVFPDTWELWKKLKTCFKNLLTMCDLTEDTISVLFNHYGALYLMYHTYQGEGVGIWDGSWDQVIEKSQIKSIQADLKSDKNITEIMTRLEYSMQEDLNKCMAAYFRNI